jgi:hypothetical protein
VQGPKFDPQHQKTKQNKTKKTKKSHAVKIISRSSSQIELENTYEINIIS